MAYDPYGNYQAPARPYYNRPNQRPGPPQPRGYERQYGSQGQDQELYDQGGYDGYNDGYADQGQWDQQQYGNQNAGYDNYGYEQQPPSRQRGPPQQQMGYGQPSTQDHPPQQRQQRNRGYMGPPIQANAPPPDRQNLGFQQPQQQRPTPRQNQYQRSQGSQDDYDPYGQPMSPVSPRGINNAPWSGHDPSEGRSSPFEPVGGRPGSRPQNKRLEDQRRQFSMNTNLQYS